jgi:hypothetical protein
MRSTSNVPKNNSSRTKEKPLRKATEFRITWRREGWSVNSASKSKRYTSGHYALEFARRLSEVDDLHGEAFVTVERREVLAGPWEVVA